MVACGCMGVAVAWAQMFRPVAVRVFAVCSVECQAVVLLGGSKESRAHRCFGSLIALPRSPWTSVVILFSANG